MAETIRVCLIGIGRTGKEIAKVLLQQESIELVMAVCSNGSKKKGKDLGEILKIRDTGIVVDSVNNLEKNLVQYRPDVAIDFSSPEATIANAKILAKNKVNMVVGTTGFNELEMKRLMYIAKNNKVGIVHAPNITLGVNVLMVLANLAASILDSYDCTIVESHFKNKKDAPSGTAKKIAREVIKGRTLDYPEGNVHELKDVNIPIHAIRAGGIIGRHSISFAGEYDKIEIIHESFSRTAFALGAIKAVEYIYNRSGFYEMNDVLDLRNVITKYLEREAIFRNQKYYNREINKEQLPS